MAVKKTKKPSVAYRELRDKFEDYARRKGVHAMTTEALWWFRRYATVFNKSASYMRTVGLGKVTTKPQIGRFYLYKYDPKTKEDMPYWDTVPLVLITSKTKDGWYGINFHYMPPIIRLRIMEGFYKTRKNKAITERMRMKADWERAVRIAQAVGAHEFLSNSIKRYLGSHVVSPLIDLDPEHWTMCLFLPLSRFMENGKGKRHRKWKAGQWPT